MSDAKSKYRRADGRICLTLTVDGKKKYFYGSTRAEAVRKRDEYKARVGAGLIDLPAGTTVAAWMDTWAQVYSIDTRREKTYLDRLREDLGALPLSRVTEAHLVQSLKYYEGKSVSGAKSYRSILSRCFSKAYKNRLIPFNPASDLDLPRTKPKGTHRALEPWEISAIMDHWSCCRAGLWAMLMLLCGIRRGEMLALTWDHVDLKARTITVAQTGVIRGNRVEIEQRAKTLSGLRTLPICAPLAAALETVPPNKRTGLVCLSAQSKPLTQIAFSRGWDTFNSAMTHVLNGEKPIRPGRRTDKEKAEPQKPRVAFSVRPHDLRHTFATILYDAGVDAKSAAYLLGHSDFRLTLDLYTHLSQDRARQSAAALTGFLDDYKAVSGQKVVNSATSADAAPITTALSAIPAT